MRPQIRGFLALFLVTINYGLFGVFFKKVADFFNVFHQHLIRNMLMVLGFSLIFLVFKKRWIRVEKKDISWILAWVLVANIATPIYYLIFKYLSVGIVNFLTHVSIVLTGFILGKIFFKEKMNAIKYLATLLVMVGLGLIYSVELVDGKLLYIGLSFLAGSLSSVWYLIPKKIPSKYEVIQLGLIDSLFAVPWAMIWIAITREASSALVWNPAWGWMGLFALSLIVGTMLTVYGFRNLEAQLGTIIMPLETIFGAFFGYLFFHEILGLKAWAGGGLIVLGAILPNAYRFVKSRSS